MKKIKLFFFSRLSIIFLLILFFLINAISFFAEYLFGEISLSIEKWIRFASIICDFVIIGFGILSWFQIVFRRPSRIKTYLRKAPHWVQFMFKSSPMVKSFLKGFPTKNLFWINFWADVLAAFSIIYSLYVIRLLIFWSLDQITFQSVLYSSLMGLVGIFLFGFVNMLVRKTKKHLRKFSNGNSKK